MGMVEDVREIAYVEIDKAFGETTAELYKKVFAKQEPEEILKTLHEVLIDVLGPKRAEERMQHIKNVLQVYIAYQV